MGDHQHNFGQGWSCGCGATVTDVTLEQEERVRKLEEEIAELRAALHSLSSRFDQGMTRVTLVLRRAAQAVGELL